MACAFAVGVPTDIVLFASLYAIVFADASVRTSLIPWVPSVPLTYACGYVVDVVTLFSFVSRVSLVSFSDGMLVSDTVPLQLVTNWLSSSLDSNPVSTYPLDVATPSVSETEVAGTITCPLASLCTMVAAVVSAVTSVWDWDTPNV